MSEGSPLVLVISEKEKHNFCWWPLPVVLVGLLLLEGRLSPVGVLVGTSAVYGVEYLVRSWTTGVTPVVYPLPVVLFLLVVSDKQTTPWGALVAALVVYGVQFVLLHGVPRSQTLKWAHVGALGTLIRPITRNITPREQQILRWAGFAATSYIAYRAFVPVTSDPAFQETLTQYPDGTSEYTRTPMWDTQDKSKGPGGLKRLFRK